MEIVPILLRDLPPMAWALQVSRGAREAALLHGADVVLGDGFAAEGAWSGDLSRTGFLSAPVLLGSGVATGGKLTIRGTSHTLDRLWAVRQPDRILLSNSLPFVLEWADSGLDSRYLHYEADFLSFIDGPRGLRRSLPTRGDGRLLQFCGSDIEVDSNLDLRQTVRFRHASFAPVHTYGGYRDHLSHITARICDNAADRRRPRSYHPLATVSRGYDSPACATIARERGATRAITFATAREGFADQDDDGTEIAGTLGLEPLLYGREDYKAGDGTAERYFLASGGGGEEVIFSAASEALAGTVLFTGFLGDTLWSPCPNQDCEKGMITYPGGGSMGEYRLHVGFVHAPLPMLDLHRQPELARISQSDEMHPWRLGGEYDRPIARRMAEEAGINRRAFGLSKKAVSAPMYYERLQEDTFGVEAAAAFGRYCVENDGTEAIARYARRRERRLPLLLFLARLADISTRYPVPTPVASALRPRLSDRWRRAGSDSLRAVHWAVAETQRRYRHCIDRGGGSRDR